MISKELEDDEFNKILQENNVFRYSDDCYYFFHLKYLLPDVFLTLLLKGVVVTWQKNLTEKMQFA